MGKLSGLRYYGLSAIVFVADRLTKQIIESRVSVMDAKGATDSVVVRLQ